MKTPFLLPYPKNVKPGSGTFVFRDGDCLLIPFEDKTELFGTAIRLQEIIVRHLKFKLPLLVEEKGIYENAVVFVRNPELSDEEYCLQILPTHIRITYKRGAGAFHAVSTLKQMIAQYGKTVPCLEIHDMPDFKARGIMLDISRDKIPTLETLYRLVDFMADLKINLLQLMIEGFSFAYPSYPFVWQGGTPFTGEDFMRLDNYCKSRYIELVPNQNSFGHMDAWLARSEFRDLAVAPEGYEVDWMPGKRLKSGSLNPLDPRSLELVNRITSDLLPYFSSELYHAGCDETFDLQFGRGREACEKFGTGRVYLDFLLKIHSIVKKYGKRMMFWGDIIMKHPELIKELPKDIIALEWGYEANHGFAEDGRKFSAAGIDFYVCPGTSSWDAISGRTDNMKANLLNAAVNGLQYGASGYLITDWGDSGHWQYQLFSYPGFAYGAALSWGVEQNREMDIDAYLDEFVFNDGSRRFSRLIGDLGNYYLLEKTHRDNVTMIFWTLHVPFEDNSVCEGFEVKDYMKIKRYVAKISDQLSLVNLNCEDAGVLEDEFKNAVRFILHGCDLGILKLYIRDEVKGKKRKELLTKMLEEVTVLIRKHEDLWLSRNRHGGLSSSVNQLGKLKEEYQKLLNEEESFVIDNGGRPDCNIN